MLDKTIQSVYGSVTPSEMNDIKRVHRALLDVEREGLTVNVGEVFNLLHQFEGDPEHRKDVRTLEALVSRMDEDGKVYPKYDLFKTSGRTFIYSDKPNLSDSIPPTVFDMAPYIKVYLDKSRPVGVMQDIVSFLKAGLSCGPVVGQNLYLTLGAA